MARKQWETTVAQVARQSLQSTYIVKSGSIPAGQSEVVDVYAPTGSVGTIKSIYVNLEPIAGSASGSVGFFAVIVSPGGINASKIVEGTGAYNAGVLFDYGHFVWASVSKYPPSDMAQTFNVRDTMFDEASCIRFALFNNTNVPSGAQNRTVQVTWVKCDTAK